MMKYADICGWKFNISANHIDCMNLLQMFNNWCSDLSCRPTIRSKQVNLNLHLIDWHTAELDELIQLLSQPEYVLWSFLYPQTF